MRKRLVVFLSLFFLVAVCISYILSSIVFNLDSNSINYQETISTTQNDVSEESSTFFEKQSFYILLFLFIVLAYLIYHIFWVELGPWFKLRSMKKREDPLELVEYLFDELKRNERKNPAKAAVLMERLNHFYEYLPNEEKKEAIKIRGLKKYIN